jgi:hypothetical protein
MLRVICVAFERTVELMTLINCFLVQTSKDWELNIIYDGQVPENIKDIMSLYSDKRIKFLNTPKRNGVWGHPNRKMMLNTIEGELNDYVLMTNDDNYYVPKFVEQILSITDENVGMVVCDCLHSYTQYDYFKSELKEGFIDMGSFVVKMDVAKKVGFNYLHYSADGAYAIDCGNYCQDNDLEIRRINRALFIHN